MTDIIYPDGQTREVWLQAIEKNRNPFYRYPTNLDQKIWRYMDFTKFVSLLSDEVLFFPKATSFSDVYEGSTTVASRQYQMDMTIQGVGLLRQELGSENVADDLENTFKLAYAAAAPDISKYRKWAREWTYISCWHVNPHESAAMWSLYAHSNEAVALQSTFRRLYNCLLPYRVPPHGEPILGMVNYIDYEKEIVSHDVHLSEYFFKRTSFTHEAELRAVIQDLPTNPQFKPGDNSTPQYYDFSKSPVSGKALKVDLNHLIDNIYVAPSSPKWFAQLTQKLLSKYGLPRTVKHSSLDNEALF